MTDPTMQQLTFLAPGRFQWHEVPRPRIEHDLEALVRPLAVARCDLDLYIATGTFPLPGPFAFGHEIAGEVLEIGAGVTTVQPGDRVIVPFQISCGVCAACRRGTTNACSSVPASSAYGLAPSSGREWGGGFADVVRVPFADAMLVGIPAGVSLAAASVLSDNAVDGFRTVAGALARQPGAEVLVVGGLAQSVGLFAVQAAIALGAGRVVYHDFDARRLAAARGLGAEVATVAYSETLHPAERFPIVVEAGGLPESLVYALRATQRCGHCTGVSAGTGNLATVPLREMYMKGVTYEVSRVHARGSLDAALSCVCRGAVDPAAIITRTLSFSDAADAMADGDIKTVFLRDAD